VLKKPFVENPGKEDSLKEKERLENQENLTKDGRTDIKNKWSFNCFSIVYYYLDIS
jgi:hypothetical protein